MESYQTWLGEGPELSVLRMLGLFDRPADEKALSTLLKSPVIPGLTELLTDLSAIAWRTMLAKLRRARLLAGEDPHNPGHLDTHPLVREYFSEQLRSQRTEAWKECNKRLYHHCGTLAPQQQRYCGAELHWLHGMLLATMGAEETQIEASFQACRQNKQKSRNRFR